MREFFEKTIEIVKFIFDFVRTIFFILTWIIKMAAIGVGLFGAAFMIYELYHLYLYCSVTKGFSIPITIVIFFLVAGPVYIIGTIWYYLIQTVYYLIGLISIPFYANNDVLINIGCFFEDILYSLSPHKRNTLAKQLGFEDWNEWQEFNEQDTSVMRIIPREEIEKFHNERG